MTSRCLLHKKDIGDFAMWCRVNGIETREGRGDFQVLQVRKGKNWQTIYERMDTHAGNEIVHMTVPTPIENIVRRFISDKKGGG